ncbi:MAG TPA: hypothetical protein ENK60_08630 [Anaerolineae bacterium]|nr:hypothetical protein [Anaerolineae bacterium]
MPLEIVWSDYLKHRARVRGFKLAEIERILRFSSERYFDVASGRYVVVGRHGEKLVLIPYEIVEDKLVPITIHATSRQQINFRIKTGRFVYVR